VTTAITTEPTLAVGAAGPVAVFTAVGTAPFSSPDHDQSRRSALVSAAGALTFVGLSIGLGRLVTTDGPASDEAEVTDEEVSTLMQEAERKSLDVHGDIPGLVSTFEEFYNVDIAEFDPDLSADGWSLTVTGEVGTDVTVTFDELTDMPTERRFVTLRAVGESLNGHKLDNAVWTGTPIKPLLEEADPEGSAGVRCSTRRTITSSSSRSKRSKTGSSRGDERPGAPAVPRPSRARPRARPLGRRTSSGSPRSDSLDEAVDGYWEQRGWHGTGPVNTVAKLWSESMLDNGHIEVAGHAYAGTRGVDAVEVSVDGGDTWRDAELSEPLPGEDVWRQWRFEFEPRASQEVVVRAIDGRRRCRSGRGAVGGVPERCHGVGLEDGEHDGRIPHRDSTPDTRQHVRPYVSSSPELATDPLRRHLLDVVRGSEGAGLVR